MGLLRVIICISYINISAIHFVSARNVPPPTGYSLRFYYDINFSGNIFKYTVGSGCINMVGLQNDAISSVDSEGNCVILWEHLADGMFVCKGILSGPWEGFSCKWVLSQQPIDNGRTSGSFEGVIGKSSAYVGHTDEGCKVRQRLIAISSSGLVTINKSERKGGSFLECLMMGRKKDPDPQ
ncbi:unnamed protein product [Allacma fusca]|uniref:Uncharacterized protein n=1 Tax=Allacma fusca TaxID=39272 RepID=A0A8J2KD68_9HEXA|nr:unnamed protein product [Allacma fusca]